MWCFLPCAYPLIEHPAISHQEDSASDIQWNGKLQTGELDREVGQVGLAGFVDGIVQATGVSAVVPVQQAASCEGRY